MQSSRAIFVSNLRLQSLYAIGMCNLWLVWASLSFKFALSEYRKSWNHTDNSIREQIRTPPRYAFLGKKL